MLIKEIYLILFFSCMQEHFKIKKEHIYSNTDHPVTYIVENNLSIGEFWHKYIYMPTTYTTNGIRNIYYKYIIFALKIIKHYRNLEDNNVDFLFFNDVKSMYVGSYYKNNNLYIHRISREKIPSNNEFKQYLTNTILNKGRSSDAFSTKQRDGFSFTMETKLLYKYYQLKKNYNNDDFRNDTSLPFWLFHGVKYRNSGIKKAANSLETTEDFLCTPPEYLANPSKNIIRFIIVNKFFNKKIEINDNEIFIEIMQFLVKLNDTEYYLTKETYFHYKKLANDLEFNIKENANESFTSENSSTNLNQEEIIFYTIEIDLYIKSLYRLNTKIAMFSLNDFLSFFNMKYNGRFNIINKIVSIKNIFASEYFSLF